MSVPIRWNRTGVPLLPEEVIEITAFRLTPQALDMVTPDTTPAGITRVQQLIPLSASDSDDDSIPSLKRMDPTLLIAIVYLLLTCPPIKNGYRR